MTKSTDVFRTMSAEESEAFLKDMRDELRPLYKQIERVAAETLRLRPVFLGRQPFPKRCGMIRKAMALKLNAEAAGEILAAYFMERHSELVTELLDGFGIEHEDGVLHDLNPESPKKKKLETAVAKFRGDGTDVMRGLLLRAFAAQTAIDWPDLDQLVFPEEKAAQAS